MVWLYGYGEVWEKVSNVIEVGKVVNCWVEIIVLGGLVLVGG